MVTVEGERQRTNIDPLPVEADVFDKILRALQEIVDAQERIQQQLAKMNEDYNLAPGDRYYA